jgi:N utilization substance protein B
MGNRRKARENALQLLYELEFAGDRPNGGKRWDSFAEDDMVASGEIRLFAEELVKGVKENEETIDECIRGASTNWKLERMALVDRNILRMATYELLYLSEIPRKVSMNEAIEIAKRFGTEDSSAFINGILDKIAGQA